MIDDFLNFTIKAMAFVAALVLWIALVGSLIVGFGVLMHVVGVFTCNTVYCS